ncbi:MAG: lacA 1 [Mucilaginibacter sp.]|nr:lacA 1 [Mucilaginibacter sp.]
MDLTKKVSRVRLNDFNATISLNRGVNKFTEVTWYLMKMIFFLTAFPFPNTFKSFILKVYGTKVGKGLIIKPRVNIHMPWKLEIGDFVWIGEEVSILNFEIVKVGNNVCISQRSFLCGGNHDYTNPAMPYRNGPITLEDGSWIGAGSFVGPNVIIGTDSIITAHSVVTRSTNVNSIYSGNPASYVKKRWSK